MSCLIPLLMCVGSGGGGMFNIVICCLFSLLMCRECVGGGMFSIGRYVVSLGRYV